MSRRADNTQRDERNVESARVREASLLWSVSENILEVRADSRFYRVLLKLLVCSQQLAVLPTLGSAVFRVYVYAKMGLRVRQSRVYTRQ